MKIAKKLALYFPYVLIISIISGIIMRYTAINDTWRSAVDLLKIGFVPSILVGVFTPLIAIVIFLGKRLDKYNVPGWMCRKIADEICYTEVPAVALWGAVIALLSPITLSIYLMCNMFLVSVVWATCTILYEKDEAI